MIITQDIFNNAGRNEWKYINLDDKHPLKELHYWNNPFCKAIEESNDATNEWHLPNWKQKDAYIKLDSFHSDLLKNEWIFKSKQPVATVGHFANLKHLQKVTFEDNIDCSRAYFSNMPNLTDLIFTKTDLTTRHCKIKHCPKLEKINVNNWDNWFNGTLEDVGIQEIIFKPSTKNGKKLYIQEHSITDCKNLTTLDFSQCDEVILEREALFNCPIKKIIWGNAKVRFNGRIISNKFLPPEWKPQNCNGAIGQNFISQQSKITLHDSDVFVNDGSGGTWLYAGWVTIPLNHNCQEIDISNLKGLCTIKGPIWLDGFDNKDRAEQNNVKLWTKDVERLSNKPIKINWGKGKWDIRNPLHNLPCFGDKFTITDNFNYLTCLPYSHPNGIHLTFDCQDTHFASAMCDIKDLASITIKNYPLDSSKVIHINTYKELSKLPNLTILNQDWFIYPQMLFDGYKNLYSDESKPKDYQFIDVLKVPQKFIKQYKQLYSPLCKKIEAVQEKDCIQSVSLEK